MSRASMKNYTRSVRSRFSIIFWPDLSKIVIFPNPSKKMRLDESFRMAQVSCHLEVVVKSYGQNTVNMSRNKKRSHAIALGSRY